MPVHASRGTHAHQDEHLIGTVSDHDPAFPQFHVRPPHGWLNDPNGPFLWRGRYHLFFQHNPDRPQHGDICWGHAVSDDLCSWSYEPVALTPTPGGPDEGGCWSGCVVDDDGVPTAVYTGFVDDEATATVCLATAADDDLRTWTKEPEPLLAAPEGSPWLGFRDPFLFTYEGRRYALMGAGLVGGGAPAVLLFGCDDLRRWTYLGPLLDGTDPVAAQVAPADIWECPQLALVDGRWVLIVSLWVDRTLQRVAYLVGGIESDGSGLRFRAANGGLVDHGSAFYAPAVLVEEDRVLLWGWSWEDRDEKRVAEAGWAGALTWPRELAMHPDGRLLSSPAPELGKLRAASTRFALSDGERIPLPAGALDIELMVRTRSAGPVTLRIGDLTGHLVLAVGTEAAGLLAIRVVVDGSLVEVYVAGGQTFTERRYPIPDGSWQLSVEGGAPDGDAESDLTVDATVHRLVLPAG